MITALYSKAAFASSSITTNRLAGNDRYDTNLQVIKSGWTSADTIFIASGKDFPDALCVSPLAEKYKAPLFLTDGLNLSEPALQEIKSLQAKNAVIIGGPALVSSNADEKLKSLGISTRRIYGQDRYETSLKIAQELGLDREVFIVTGENFPDALSIASVASKKQAPIMLVSKNNSASNNTSAAFINSKGNIHAYIIGGTSVISSTTAEKFTDTERLYGSDRYETNINILRKFDADLDYSKLYITTGGNYPDALSGANLAASTNSPLVLSTRTPKDALKQLFNEKADKINSINMLGGDPIIRDYTVDNLINNTAITVNEPEPLSDAEQAAIDAKKQLDAKYAALSSKVSNYLSKQSGSYGVYFINLINGETFGYNYNTRYIGASTVKVPINLYAYELRREGRLSGDTKFQYLSSDYETGTGTLQYSKPGGYYSVKDLSRLSIRISDNVAINMLKRNLSPLDDFYSYLGGIVGHSIQPWHNVWSPKDMALFMKGVYDFDKLDDSLGQELLDNLENTIFNDRINRYLPGVTVAHKIGNQVNAMHDVGIVYAKQPYVVCFMSSNVNENTACEVIGQASKMIYDFVKAN